MPTYRCVVEYDGTDFCGWQYQPAVRTVCGEIEGALSDLFDETVKLTAAGRTDTGVHATGQVVSFASARVFPVDRLPRAVNARLAPDVTVRGGAIVDDGFSARHDARTRTYEYLILNRPTPSATLRRLTHHVYAPLDAGRFARAAAALVGTYDFTAFCGVLPDRGGTVRTVRSIELQRNADVACVRIVGDGFLHRMVRITVGTLIEVATGRRAVDDMPAIVASRDRRRAGYTAPAAGLFLAGVRYDGFDSYQPAFGAAPPVNGRRSD